MPEDPHAEARDQLLTLRDELKDLDDTSRQSSEVVDLDQSRVGRLSRMDALQAQAVAQATGRRRADLVARIDAALRRLDDGSYGLCLQCGEAIASPRLAIDPAASLCIRCQAEREQ